MRDELYERDGVSVHIQVEDEASNPTDEWIERMRATLDLLPIGHIRLFNARGEGYIRIGRRPESGGAFGYAGQVIGDGVVPRTFVHVSYDAMSRGYNQGRYLYTMLHETGHVVDHYQFVNGDADPQRCIDLLRDDDPLGCLAILRRYHSGATMSPSEHFSDIYADYFYNAAGGEDYNVRRNEPGWRCEDRQCAQWDAALVRRLERSEIEYPARDADEVIAIRYRALFRCPAFAGVRRVGAEVPPSHEAGVAVEGAPASAPRSTSRGARSALTGEDRHGEH